MAWPASCRRILQARFGIAAFDFQHLRELELGQPRMREVEGNRDARHAVGREPFVGEPVERAEDEPARVELGVDLGDPRFELGAFDRQPEIAHPDLEQLLVAERRPVGTASAAQDRRRLFRPFRVALVGVGDAKQRRFVERPAGQLQADRQAVRR